MATAKRESLAKNFLDQRHPRKVGARKKSHRHLVTLSEEEISRREQGWNDRFTVDPPPKSNKVLSPAHSPTYSIPQTPLTKEAKIRSERAQYGKRGGKRNREPKKPSSEKLVPLGALSKPPSEAAQSTKEEKLRFKVLKAIDARESLLYQLSALILCTPVQESLFLPSRPLGPPASSSGGRQQMRPRGGIALSSTPLSRHGGNPGAMTNSREATKLAQQLATDLQVTGIQCVESLVEWMLEAGAQAETPPPFLWRGRNYFLKMLSDLDFAESELQARGVNLDCFKQRNPLLIKPNQKLGRVLAAHSIIMEMVEFAKDITPRELHALSGRLRDSNGEEIEGNNGIVEPCSSSRAVIGTMSDTNDHIYTMERGQKNLTDKKALERDSHESAADLVDLLDESIDFIRDNASRERVVNQVEPCNENEDEDGGVNNNDGLSSGTSPREDDNPADELEPGKASKSEKGEAATDDQSNVDDNSVDGHEIDDEPVSRETYTPQPVSKPPKQLPEDTDDVDGPDPKSNNTLDEISPDTELDTLGIPSESAPETKQLSSRTNASDNQSEYENSFDADAGGVDGDHESTADFQQVTYSDENDSADPIKSATPHESVQDEAVDPSQKLPTEPSTPPEEQLTSRTEDTNGSEYDNSFEEEVEEGVANNDLDADIAVAVSDYAVVADAPPATTVTDVPAIIDIQLGKRLIDAEEEQPVPETDDPQTISKRLVNELKKWAFLEDESRPTEVDAQACLAWRSTRALTEALRRHSSIGECMEGSIMFVLEQYGLAVPEPPLVSLLCSEVAQELDLASHLLDECHGVQDDVCSIVADNIQCLLRGKSPFVSEIEVGEVLEVTETVRQEYHASTWEHLKVATTLSIFLRTSNNDALTQLKNRPAVSAELSSLVKVFYPYLVNQPREELSDNWHPVSSVLAAMGLPVERLYFMLDPMCKTLLLAVEMCSRSNQDSQDGDPLAVFPKLSVICDREDVLQSSVESVWHNHLSSDKVTSSFSLFPFFKSSFGEKLVDGVRVEEGEGKGPLKEWFGLVGTQLPSKWKQIPTNKFLTESTQGITVSGNTITIPGAAEVICPGFQLEWETSDGETIRRVVNKIVGDDTFLLDRNVPSHSFTASELRVSQPITAILEYVQGSESFWLNENARDSPETRNVLVFVGWFLASALTHFSSIQLRIHPLLFRLLLCPRHCVTLDEVLLFDPELFKSLSGMKDMKTSDFAEYLKFEGADETISVEAYIGKVLEKKFGPASGIAWQLESVRYGFTRVISVDQIHLLGITEVDLAESICGSSAGSGDDFVVNEVFRVAADTDFTNCVPLMTAFWQTVNNFDPQLKRRFIKFVTGVDTLPLVGTEFLRIEMPFTVISPSDYEKCLQMLPQAHTCDNALELPHYWKALCWREQHDEHKPSSKLEEELARLLEKKLRDAVEYSSGYGLDGTSAVAGVIADKAKSNNELAIETSYDSLGLPALSEDSSAADQPVENAPSSPQPSEHEKRADQEVEVEVESPAESETKAEPLTVAVSPRPAEESYDEYDDWEEESMA